MKLLKISLLLTVIPLTVYFLSPFSGELTYKYEVLLIGGGVSKLEKRFESSVEEMLISWNIPFKKIELERRDLGVRRESLDKDLFVRDGKVLFTSVIITRKFEELSNYDIKILKKISKRYGVSIISFFSLCDNRGKDIFGIEKLSSEKEKSVAFYMGNKEEYLCGNFGKNEAFRGDEFLKIKIRNTKVIVKSKGFPIFFYNKFGKGVNYYFNFSPRAWSVFDGKHIFFRRAIFQNSGNGFIYFDFEGLVVLRCDDFLRNISWDDDQSYQKFYYKRMGIKDWESLVEVLKNHNAGMSLAVVTGFKDDGERERGDLYVNGKKIQKRYCGQIFDSKDVKYIFKIKKKEVLDYEEEFRGLKLALKEYENLDIQPHGFTHLNPEESWCNATKKHDNHGWGVEFFHLLEKRDISEEYQKFALEEGYIRILNWFETEPFVFVPPGLLVSSNTDKVLKEFGYRYFFDSFQLKKLFNGNYRSLNFVYVVPVKELEWWIKPSYKRIFVSLPVVLGLHDVDFTYFGFDWFDGFLTMWEKEGVKRFVSLGEFVGILSSKIYAEYDGRKVKLVVDISEPIGPKNLETSKFFSKRNMFLTLRIPDKWKNKTGKDVMEIAIPPFKKNKIFKGEINFSKTN